MSRRQCQEAAWAALPCDILAHIMLQLPQRSRVAALGVCKTWRTVAEREELWQHIEFATHREGTRRTELRRLLSLAAWAKRHARHAQSMAISARVPPDFQPAALKAASDAVLAAAASLQRLSLTSNRGFWPGAWLPRLQQLRHLRLCSIEGGLSLNGDLSPLLHLTSLVLEAKQAVTLQDHVRLPPSIVSCELSCIRDTLPPQLSQLTRLSSLAVRRACISEGVLLVEHEALAHLTGLTSLALEQQEEEAWLPPPELLTLTALRHLSIAGNDCSRWPLHGSDEAFELMLGRMAHLTSLDISGCCLEELPGALLTPADGDGAIAGGHGALGAEGEQSRGAASLGPRLLRLLAHGNQLEEGGNGDGALLVFPRSVQQLSIDWQVLQALRPPTTAAAAAAAALSPRPAVVLPARCRQLALLGREGIDAALLATLPRHLPELRQIMLEPDALDVLWRQSQGGISDSCGEQAAGSAKGDWRLVGGRWRPTRLPGQPRRQAAQPQQDVQRALREAGVEVLEVRHASQLAALLDQLAVQREVQRQAHT